MITVISSFRLFCEKTIPLLSQNLFFLFFFFPFFDDCSMIMMIVQ